jgi:ETC complex I subunit conserved region
LSELAGISYESPLVQGPTFMLARIYRPAKTAMQSGKGKSNDWRLEFEPTSARVNDPLMGWIGSTDMNGQVRLEFETKEDAVAYAERHGIAFRLHEPQEAPVILKAYADNFATFRKQPWTH